MKPIHTYKVEFQVYGEYVNQDIHFCAYSQKQAKKFFYDWWKKHHPTKYAVVTMISQLDDKYAEELSQRTTGETLKERLKSQSDHIYRRKEDK
ncbi:MAG: hypothetical protein J6S67_22685 [Methanobrevibacter sp.]|nr:hypothetical protein [Methanobrevibacter sp.]